MEPGTADRLVDTRMASALVVTRSLFNFNPLPMGRLKIDRYYDPQAGQFLSVDSDLSATFQPYLYTGDNPINVSDPTGLCRDGWWEVWCPVEAAWDQVIAIIGGVVTALESAAGCPCTARS